MTMGQGCCIAWVDTGVLGTLYGVSALAQRLGRRQSSVRILYELDPQLANLDVGKRILVNLMLSDLMIISNSLPYPSGSLNHFRDPTDRRNHALTCRRSFNQDRQ